MLTVTIVISALMLSFIAFPLSATAQGPDSTPEKAQVVSALGIVPGRDLIVHIWVVVPPGADKNEAANEALRNQGARPLTQDEFSTISLLWDQFSDGDLGNDFVIQNYNPNNDPTNGQGKIALLNTHATWSGVVTSIFNYAYGEDTDRCPSLVRECPGRQTFDGNNDVAWLALRDKNVLGVTWSGTSIDEADMALNTKFTWNTNGDNFDVETVYLHENGHVLGLGHSAETGAVMEAVYDGERRILHQDDIDGISFLYPSSEIPEDTVAPTVVSGETSSSTSIELTMSESVVDNSVTPDDFEVFGVATSPTVTGISVSGSVVSLTLDAKMAGGETITVSYTQTSGFIDDTSGNHLANFSGQSVTNNLGTSSSTVSVSSIDYATEGGKFQDKHLLITISLVDGSGNLVSGASVSIDLFRDDSKVGSGTGTTGSSGTITFSLKNAASGFYTTDVTGVTASGLIWDGITPSNGFNK